MFGEQRALQATADPDLQSQHHDPACDISSHQKRFSSGLCVATYLIPLGNGVIFMWAWINAADQVHAVTASYIQVVMLVTCTCFWMTVIVAIRRCSGVRGCTGAQFDFYPLIMVLALNAIAFTTWTIETVDPTRRRTLFSVMTLFTGMYLHGFALIDTARFFRMCWLRSRDSQRMISRIV